VEIRDACVCLCALVALFVSVCLLVSQPTVPQFASSAPVPTIVPAPDLDVLVTDTGEVTNGMNMNTGREIPDPAAVLGVASTGPAAGPSTVAMAPAAADVAAVQGHLVARKRHVPPPVTTPSRVC